LEILWMTIRAFKAQQFSPPSPSPQVPYEVCPQVLY